MNFDAVKFIVEKYSSKDGRKGFVNFVWWAAVVSISIGVVALVISTSVLDGFQNAIQENAIRFTSHIKVLTFKRQPIVDVEQIVRKINSVEGVEAAFPSVEKEILIRTKTAVDGVVLQSLHMRKIESLQKIEFNKEQNLSQINGVIIGRMLAERLSLNIGDSVLLMSISVQDSIGFTKTRFLKTIVAGVFESGMAKYDDLFVYANSNVLEKLDADTNNYSNSIDVYVDDITQIDSIAKRIEFVLGYPFYCLTYYDLHSSIFAWIELQKEPIPIVLSLITIVAIFNVVTFLLVNVVEKTKSIGILSSIGLTTKEITLVFLQMGMKIALIGLGIGVGISLLFSILQKYYSIIRLDSKIYYFSSLPVDISALNYILVTCFTLFLTLLSSLIPSLIAARINPVNTIRFIK
ncbi:MAG: ABC transporter permease [Candidatus Kapaibacteriota bacterium]